MPNNAVMSNAFRVWVEATKNRDGYYLNNAIMFSDGDIWVQKKIKKCCSVSKIVTLILVEVKHTTEKGTGRMIGDREVFAGDVVKMYSGEIYQVKWSSIFGRFYLADHQGRTRNTLIIFPTVDDKINMDCEIIGTIHDTEKDEHDKTPMDYLRECWS